MKRVLLLLTVLLLAACDQTAETPQKTTPANEQYSVGTVLETIDVDSYTYLRLDQQGKEVWLASNPVWVKKGDVVKYSDPALMKDFHSKTLNRTFPYILFVNNVELVNPDDPIAAKAQAPQSAAPPPQAATPPSQVANPHANAKSAVSMTVEDVDVKPLAGGKTIAEIFADAKKLEGQEVSLRAKVVKYSPNIMGKNWITLADGTGEPPDNKLVVTSKWTVSVGDEAIATGKVRNNVDIGAGYKYKVLLEEARFD